NSFGTYSLWKKNPEQVINAGIAEANAMGVAAGLSALGFKPYVHSFAPFATRRSFDQSFLSIGYGGNSARIIGSDAGITAAFNGGTHMPFEDMALMRAIPHSTVIEVSDASMFSSILRSVKDKEGVTYIRTSRKTYPAIYSNDHAFAIGKGEIIRDGNDVTIIAIGIMLGEAMKAAEALSSKGLSVRVVDMFTVKPIDTDLLKKCAEETKCIVTAENHNIIGGLGDAVLGALSEMELLVKTAKVGIHDEFGAVGPEDFLKEKFGLTADSIIATIRKILNA
ncbi:MAG: transketolase family protein, partial [Clostridiales bacterium]|nr:transketolase family protein [Clostridiales bacterium]